MAMRGNGDGSADPGALQGMDLVELLIEQVVDYAIFVLDADGNIASWNSGAQRIKGYAPAEIIGKPYAIFFPEEERLRGRPDEILRIAREQGRFQDEDWRVRKDGTRFWASVVVTALRDASGTLKGFAKITRDLTERRLAEEQARQAVEERAARRQAELDEREVRRSRDQLDLILRSITEGVTAQRPDGHLIFANEAAAHMSGFESARAMLAAPLQEIAQAFDLAREDGTPLPPDELPGRIALTQGTPSTTVVRFRARRTGEERWSFVSSAPVLDPEGNVEFAVTVFREFTDRRRTEQAWQLLADASVALGSSLDYRATLAKLTTLAVPQIADWCSVDILAATGRLEQLAVFHTDPKKAALAKEWRRRWPPDPEVAPSYRVVRSGQAELLAEIPDDLIDKLTMEPEQKEIARELGLRSAMIVPLVVGDRPFGVVSFVAAESGRRYGREDLIVATEIARRASLAVENARAYGEARSAVQTRDNFLAIASHELRTPLSGLSVLMTSMLRAANQGRLLDLGPEGLKDRIAKAERQTRQLTRLVDRLLDVSRLSNRDLQLEREPTDLVELVGEVVSRYEDAASETGTHIEVQTGAPSINSIGYWDRSRLDQVLTNLIGNSIKYGAGAPITVSVGSGTAGRMRLTVRDEGPGIDLEHQDRIFGQFERAAPDENIPGMGLGLWLVRRIVAAHGGTVTLDSRPGQGATFTIVLPTGQEDTHLDGQQPGGSGSEPWQQPAKEPAPPRTT